jgi:hypothetical protein
MSMTEQEAKDFYGADATDWLKRWDEGRIVHTIEMGGLGPGYEQCIHVTCAEILRVMLAEKYDSSKWAKAHDDLATWRKDRDDIDAKVMALPLIKDLGLSGAQWGAALNVASHLYMHGPAKMLSDERVKDRHIQVSNNMKFEPRERATA